MLGFILQTGLSGFAGLLIALIIIGLIVLFVVFLAKTQNISFFGLKKQNREVIFTEVGKYDYDNVVYK